MASKRPETMAKRAREQAVREKRELKKAKKEARLAAAAEPTPVYGEDGELIGETAAAADDEPAGEPA